MPHDDLDTPRQVNVIAVIPKNTKQELRVSFGTFKGHAFVDARVYTDPPTDRGALGRVATRKGLAVSYAALPDLIRALQAAQALIAAGKAPANDPEPSTRKARA